jgi:putative spermidine/putrescine transport system substrate-binding protein
MKTTRRTFLKSVAIGAAAVGFPAVIRKSHAAGRQLVFCGFGGNYQEGQSKALFEPYEKETGVKIIQTTGVDLAKLRTQVQSGNVEWDVLSLPDRLRYTAVYDNMVTKLDYRIIDKTDIMPNMVTDYAIGGVTIPMLLTWNKNAYKGAARPPQSWKEFWDVKKFPGARGVYNRPTYTLEFALIADGVPKDKLYPLDVDRAFRSLNKIKKDVKVWWTEISQPGVLLKTGEVAVTYWPRTISAVLQGEPLGYTYNEAALTFEAWVVPKGSKNAELAMQFINWAMRPKPQAELTKYIAFGPTNKKAMQFVDPKVRTLLSSYPDNAAKGFLLNGDWWGPNLDKVNQQWNEWQLG